MKKIWKFLGKSEAGSRSGSSSGSGSGGMQKIPWNPLMEEDQLQEIRTLSFERPQLIFKHSTRCGISAMMLRRLEGNWNAVQDTVDFYLLDLLAYRSVSSAVESEWDLPHQSPQVLLIRDGRLLKATSHSGIAQFAPLQQ